jgi:hypothetical protein
MQEGYYWARHTDGTTFVVLLEDGDWYCCAVHDAIDFDESTIICKIASPAH